MDGLSPDEKRVAPPLRQHPAPFAGCDDRRAERLGVVHDVPVRAVGGGEGFLTRAALRRAASGSSASARRQLCRSSDRR